MRSTTFWDAVKNRLVFSVVAVHPPTYDPASITFAFKNPSVWLIYGKNMNKVCLVLGYTVLIGIEQRQQVWTVWFDLRVKS